MGRKRWKRKLGWRRMGIKIQGEDVLGKMKKNDKV